MHVCKPLVVNDPYSNQKPQAREKTNFFVTIFRADKSKTVALINDVDRYVCNPVCVWVCICMCIISALFVCVNSEVFREVL